MAKVVEDKPVFDQQQYNKGLQTAVDFATLHLTNLFRKQSNLPYMVHCFDVMSLVRSWGISDLATLQACLNHDTFEENLKITDAMMIAAIGKIPTGYCRELTFIPDPNLSDGQNLKAKEQYLQSFINKSVPALVIKCADRICNTKDFLAGSPSYAPKYWSKAAILYHTMIARMSEIEAKFPGSGLFMKRSKDRMEEVLKEDRHFIMV